MIKAKNIFFTNLPFCQRYDKWIFMIYFNLIAIGFILSFLSHLANWVSKNSD
jgi:hypothetical protein